MIADVLMDGPSLWSASNGPRWVVARRATYPRSWFQIASHAACR